MTATLFHHLSRRLCLSRVAIAMACVALLCPCAQAIKLHEGLIAYWPLDEGTGETAFDVAPSGAEEDDGLLRDEPSWLDADESMFGDSALYFEGFQDVLVSDSADLNITTNAVTVSAWFNTEFLPSELLGSFGSIYDSAQDSYVLYLDRGNRELRFKVTDENGTAERPGVPESMLTTGDWHHVMGVYDGANATAKIYFNGQFVDSHPNAGLIDPVRTGQIAAIGGNPLTDPGFPGSNFFSGYIDDVAIWNRALGQGEAKYLYSVGNGHSVGEANPEIAFLPDRPPVDPVEPTVQPVIHYSFEGNLANSGTGGATYDGTLIDTPGLNEPPYGPGTVGLGLDLRENTIQSNTEGDAVSVDYVLTDNGTIMFDYTVDQFYNYQSLWTNSADANDWEMWIYQDGILRGRVQDSAIASYDLNLLDGFGTYQVAFTWERTDDNVDVKLYIDGEMVNETFAGPWVDPGGTFFIGGGDGGNNLGAGIWDEFRIYDVALSEGEILYLSMQGTLAGDYNGDGQLDAADLDLQARVATDELPFESKFDENGDGEVTFADREIWLEQHKETWIGDSNLDFQFNTADFVAVLGEGKYETGERAGWAQGDWNGDLLFGTADLVVALSGGGYERGPFPGEGIAAVPEPTGLALFVLSLLGIAALRRRS